MENLFVRSAGKTLVLALGMWWVFTGFASPAEASPSLTLEHPVHFAASDGSDIVAEAGTYQVDAADSRLRLNAEGRTPLLLKAEVTTHNEEIDSPLAITVPGEDSDVLHVVLVLPNGQGLDAAGSLSGIRPKGVSPRMFSQRQFTAAFLAQAPQFMVAAVSTGVVIYENPNFGGRSQTLGVGEHRLSDFNEMASSIRVPNGLVALLYEHADTGGGYGLSVDLLEDHPDLAQVNFNKRLSYVTVFSSTSTASTGPEVRDHRVPSGGTPPPPQRFIWLRNSVQNGQFVAGHWERPRASGAPVNTIAVVSPPIPSRIKAITTIQVNDAQTTISSLGEQSASDAARWDFANGSLMMGVIGSDFRGAQEIGSAAVERKSGTIGIPDFINFWYPQRQPNDHRRSPYFKRTLSGTLDPVPGNPETINITGTYEDFDLDAYIRPSAPFQYLITQGHKSEGSAMQDAAERWQSRSYSDPLGDPKACKPFTVLEAEITTRLSARTKIDSLVRTRIGKQIAVYGPWIYDRGHCYQPEIHPAEQIWWSTVQGSNKYFNLNLFCDASGRFWWRDQMDDGSKLKPWGAPPIIGTFAIAFEVQLGKPTTLFEVTNLGDYNVAFVPNSNKPHNLVYQNSILVSFIPNNDAFKVSYENVGLKAGTTDIVRGFLVLEATVGTVTQIATRVPIFPPAAHSIVTTVDFPPGTDPNKIAQQYERQVFKKVEGHYMFLIRQH